MEAKTQTTLSCLGAGDRFYFTSDTKRIVYQSMGTAGAYTEYNIVDEKGTQAWKYNRLSSNKKEVTFLRHTNLVQ